MSDDEEGKRAVQVSTRLERELVRALERRARAERRSVSNCIAAIVAAAVEPERGRAA
jgi:hypothetical protein